MQIARDSPLVLVILACAFDPHRHHPNSGLDIVPDMDRVFNRLRAKTMHNELFALVAHSIQFGQHPGGTHEHFEGESVRSPKHPSNGERHHGLL